MTNGGNMTLQEIIDSPVVPREDKLVAAYFAGGDRLSRGVYSTIDALVYAPPLLREQLVQRESGDEDEYAIDIRMLADAVERMKEN